MFVSTNAAGPSIERSTCDSAARCITASGLCSAKIGEHVCVANVGVFKGIKRAVGHARDILKADGISQRIKVNHRMTHRYRLPHNGRADKPRTVPTSRDIEWLSCTKSRSIPWSANDLRLQLSEKNPRLSPNRRGVTRKTPANFVGSIMESPSA